MKYTLPKSYANAGLQVNIPDSVLKQYRSELGSTKAAVDKWLYENGHMAKVEYEAMSETHQAKKPAKREFKIDPEKSELITWLAGKVDNYTAVTDLEIVNPNRMISFSLGNNKYELTLVRKKASK
jgi:hypothetical protein